MSHRLCLIVLTLLAGCSGGLPPTFEESEIEADRLEGRRYTKLATTARADLPTGDVTYDGRMGGQITGDLDGRIIGDMAMTVDFEDGNLDGTIRNINVTDRDGVPTQTFGGTLDIDGVEADGTLVGSASGALRLSDLDDNIGVGQLELVLNGDIRSENADGDAMAGTVTGVMAGDLNLTIFDGYFYGARD